MSHSMSRVAFEGGARNTVKQFVYRILLTAAGLATPVHAQAALITWAGNSSPGWSSAVNWVGGAAPVTGDSLVFNGSGTAGSSLTNTLTNDAFTIANVTFGLAAPAYTFAGNRFLLGTGMTNNSSQLQTFSNGSALTATAGTGGLLVAHAATFGVNGSGGNLTITNGLDNAANSDLTLTVNGAGGTLTLGGVDMGFTGSSAKMLNLAGTSNLTINGFLKGAANLAQQGTGTVTINGSIANTMAGAVSLLGSGSLVLDFSNLSTPTNLMPATDSLLLGGGGAFAIKGKAGATTAQTFSSLSLAANSSSLFQSISNGATAINLNLGSISRGAGSTADASQNGAGAITTSSTTLFAGTNKVLTGSAGGAAFATFQKTDWLTNNAGTLGITSGLYQTNLFAAGGDTDLTASQSPAAFTINTLRFNTAAKTLTLKNTGASTITTGGILVTPAGAGSIIAAGGVGAALQAGAVGREVVIHDYADLTISAPIIDNGAASALTLSGSGITTLAGANTYTGATNIDSGTVKAGSNSALGVGSAMVLSGQTGATLDLNGFDLTVGSIAGGSALGGNIVLGAKTLTVGGDNTSTTYGGVLSGAGGNFTKIGAGALTLNATSTYTGATVISGGMVAVHGALSGTTSVAVSNAAGLLLNGGGSSLNPAATISLGTGTGGASLAFTNPAGSALTESLGALTLSKTATIDFGAGNTDTFTFASLNLSAVAGTSFTGLTVAHWSGSLYSAASLNDNGTNTDRLLFNGSQAFTDAQLTGFHFTNDAGLALGTGGHQVKFGASQFEIVPIPEPSVLGQILLVAAWTAWVRYGTARRLVARLCPSRLLDISPLLGRASGRGVSRKSARCATARCGS